MKPLFQLSKLALVPLLCLSSAMAQEPTFSWAASEDFDGDAFWPAAENEELGWLFDSPAIPQYGETRFPSIQVWFSSPSARIISFDEFGDSRADVSWELVFRPGDLDGSHVIFETGGGSDATALVLVGDTLEFRAQDSDEESQRLVGQHVFTAGDELKFHHVVATVRVGEAGTNELNFYIDGGAPVATFGATGEVFDWSGGDGAGLGRINDDLLIELPELTPFDGDLALMNYYQSTVLTGAEVQAKFDALSAAGDAFDSESDGLPDLWERRFFGNTGALPGDDEEPDGLLNSEEIALGTDPTKADTDGDGIDDADERASNPQTEPTIADTDCDGLNDGDEIALGSSPTMYDSDGDGFNDRLESDYGFDPNDDDKPVTDTRATIVWVSNDSGENFKLPIGDEGWVNLLRLQGFVVLERDIRELDVFPEMLEELNAADLVIVSRETSSGRFATTALETEDWNLKVTTPLIQMSSFIVRSSRWLWFDTSDLVTLEPSSQMIAGDPTHPIFDGVVLDENDGFIANDGEVSLIKATDAGNGTVLGTDAETGNAWIVLWEKGVEFYEGSGQMTGAPRMWLGGGLTSSDSQNGAENFTLDGERLFLNAVSFLAEPPKPVIEDFSYDETTDRISITWTSIPGAIYSLDYSTDFDFDQNINDSIEATEETRTLEFDNPVPGATRLYFQVSEAE